MSEELIVTLDPNNVESIRTVTTDERGRAYLGADVANSEITFAILNTEELYDDLSSSTRTPLDASWMPEEVPM